MLWSDGAALDAPPIPPDLVTPALIVDVDRVRANVARMQALADAAGIALRPHAKTHKSLDIGRIQRAAGSVGLTVGTMGEAEVFAGAGFDDLFFAYPVWAVGDRARRLRDLHEATSLRIGLDTRAAADALATISRPGRRVQVVIEVDCGARRCGIPPAEAGSLGAYARSVGLEVVGAFTYPGHGDGSIDGRDAASRDELAALGVARDALLAEGIEPRVLSGGSTPTSRLSARPPVTELRPGEYVYNDLGKLRLGACEPGDIALVVATTVVSDAVPGQVIVDVGTKALGREGSPERGYGRPASIPSAVLSKLNEYHGYLAIPEGTPRPAVGEVLAIVPNHVCPAVNLFDEVTVLEGGRVTGRWPVDARGHLS
ncbi:MAG TPA: alanine racemase [Candidatus Limnocylindrales bacterium]|nr:alanine racemase [Candidatus Limnocylindrales bacterium]